MKVYIKPKLEVIELQIEENIAATIPKSLYKKGTTGFTQDQMIATALASETLS